MKASIVKELNRQLNNPLPVKINKFLTNHPFDELHQLIYWVKEQLKIKLAGETEFLPFEDALPSDLHCVLSKADTFYSELFHNSEFINEYTQDKESIKPFTQSLAILYERFFGGEKTTTESLIIYTELRKQIEKQLGDLLAKDETLQTYELWEVINKELKNEYEIYHTWLNAIPTERIQQEKHKFNLVPVNTPFSKLAFLEGSGRHAEQNAANYIAHCSKINKSNAFHYFTAATRHADIWDLTTDIYLQQQLLYRIGIKEWLLFVDSLVYLNIQNHCFWLLTEIDDYVNVIKPIISAESSQTPKEYLLLSALQNYFEFAMRTLQGLQECSGTRYNSHSAPNKEKIYKAAEKVYIAWKDKIIPQTFLNILNEVFKEEELSKSKYFLIFFDWINSFSKSNLVDTAADTRAELIDLLNELFQRKLESNNADIHHLIDQLVPEQLSFEALKKLLFAYLNYKHDYVLRDKLYATYLTFFNSEKFSWHADNSVRYSDAINNCYYLSNLFCSYDDGIKKWETLLKRHKTNFDGWNRTFPDYKTYQKESFLFCVGIGIAYYYYENKQKNKGDIILFDVLQLLIKQNRNCITENSTDYKTPLKFAALSIGSHSPENSDQFISIITHKCDNLHTLLLCIFELKEYNKQLTFSDLLKMQIRMRIDIEFEFLKEKSASQYEISTLIELKRTALELCSNNQVGSISSSAN